MLQILGYFPFGQPVRRLVQVDRSPKRVFVLGVYASAVHARWVAPSGKQLVCALAVASEPYMFWRGEDAAAIIERVNVPAEAGALRPAAPAFNGPSGVALDERFLHPLGLTRADAWLCDLVPHSCVNPAQQRAISREYLPLRSQLGLPEPSVPPVPTRLADTSRQDEIVDELSESEASVLMLLGDEPVKWFLSQFDGGRRRLADFGTDADTYGRLHLVRIAQRAISVLPLVHPRQAAKLGRSSSRWYDLHRHWLARRAPDLLKEQS